MNTAAAMKLYSLPKAERLSSKKAIEELFSSTDSRAFTVFPLRAVYLLRSKSDGDAPLQMLISVPKRCFKRAVKRNRVKRQVREAFRLQKAQLEMQLMESGQTLYLAFIWLDHELQPSENVEQRVALILKRISERL